MTRSQWWRLSFGRRTSRLVIGAAIALVVALSLWFGWRWERGNADRMAETAPAAGGDLVPPLSEEPPAPPVPSASGNAPTDVIPPEEP